ncbi:MAG: Tfp pilus assembly protein FimT/FimU [Kiritimatiellia bacterium]
MPRSLSQGFTLLELLLVVAIAGILLAIVAPNFSEGLAGTRMQMAAQSVMHLSRYARNMAVLQQQPAELSFVCGEQAVIQVLTQTKTRQLTDSKDDDAGGVLHEEGEEESNRSDRDALSVSDTDSVQRFKNLRFTVEYEDELVSVRNKPLRRSSDWRSVRRAKERKVDEEAQENPPPVRFNANGTCRPFRVTITDLEHEESSLVVLVDMLGVAQVEEAD